MAEVYITSQKLIEVLQITDEKLEEIESHFDAIPDDKWELLEGKDYRVVIQTTGLREYTPSGAYAIAEYLEQTRQAQEKGLLGLLRRFIRKLKGDIRKAFVRDKILNNCSSLVKRSDQFFISESDAVVIFGTHRHHFRKMAELAKSSDKTILLETIDYADFIDDSERYFSLSGIYKLSQVFGQQMAKKNRQDWCKDVGEVIKPQVDDIVHQILRREKHVQSAMKNVKKRDHKTCQITNVKQNRANQPKLAAHHLYSRAEYPHLADVENNLITLTTDVHDQFHQHMEGYDKCCTIDDLIKFVQTYYPQNAKVITWLNNQKLVLGNPQPIDMRKPHVLYLPASKVI
jgi:hypothetical protein